MKFQVQSGELKLEQLKAKLKDLFPKEEDNKAKMLTIIEILTVNNKSYNVLQHDGKKDAWKEQLVDFAYDLVKGDLAFLTTSLEKRFKDLSDRSEFMQTIRSSSKNLQKKMNLNKKISLRGLMTKDLPF